MSQTPIQSKKICIEKAGAYDVLKWKDFILEAPKDNEIQIEIVAFGVNYADCLVRWGVYESAKKFVGWPITPGFEFSGHIKVLGKNVKNFSVGDKVFGITRFGAYASSINVVDSQVWKIPAQLNMETAAAFPAVHLTAYHALFQLCRLYPKSKILVHSAAGGVGTALCQLSRRAGFHTVGIVGSANKIQVAKDHGADEVLVRDARGEYWNDLARKYPDGFDAIYDAFGSESYSKSYELLASSGKLFVYGSHGMLPQSGGRLNFIKILFNLLKTPKFKPFDMITRNRAVIGFNVSFLFDRSDIIQEGMTELLKALESGELKSPLVQSFPATQVVEAHKRIESGQSVGKLALVF